MLIPRRTVRTSQPQGPAWLKRNGSLISGLSVAYVPSIGRDLVHDVTPVTSGMARGINTSGVAIRDNGSGGYVQFTDTPLAGDIVIGCVFTVTRTDAVQLLVARVLEVEPYPQNYVLGVYAGELYFGMSADSYAKITCPISANTIYSALATFSADTKVWSLFVDGKLVATRTGTALPDAATSGQETRIGRNNGGYYPVYGDINLAYIGSECPSSPAARSLSANHWQIFEDEEDYLFVPDASGGGSVSLIVADALHGHAVDSPSFSMATYLAVAESLHTHAADNVTLATTGTANLVVQEATHAHVADGVTLTTQWLLAVAEALHSHTADNITLGVTGTANLAIADATSGHTSDTVALTLNSLLAVFDAIHAHSADNLTLDTSNATALTVQDSTHAHGADNLGLSLDTWLAIVEAAHGHTADAPTLSLGQLSLQIADALHAMYSDIVFLTLPGGNLTTDQKFIIRATARRLAAIGLARNNIINRRAS